MRVPDGDRDSLNLMLWFIELGVAYHVAASMTVAALPSPIGGVLAHQAIEMYLKAFLAGTTTEHARRDFGHSLQKLWERFDEVTNEKHHGLSSLVAWVAKSWDTRYPERIAETPTVFVILGRGEVDLFDISGSVVIALDDLDRVAQAVLTECKVSVESTRARLIEAARGHWLAASS